MRTPYAFTIASIALVCGHATAQTLDQNNFGPVPGNSFDLNLGAYQPPGNAGANQTWNFSTLGTNNSMSTSYMAPSATPYASNFPGATVAQDAGGGNFVYLTVNAQGMELRGLYSAGIGSSIVYSNPERVFAFPCSYNSTWSDTFSSNFLSFGAPVARAGTVTGTADGFGTLIMPYGTITNVLRVRVVEDFSDVISGVGTIDYDQVSINYIKPGVRMPLLTLNDGITTQQGVPQISQSAIWTGSNAIGMEELLRNAIGIELFPNPASSQVNVLYGSQGGRLQLDVLDAIGRLAHSESLSASAGIAQHTFDVSQLPAGLYQVRITATNGEQGVQRLVVE